MGTNVCRGFPLCLQGWLKESNHVRSTSESLEQNDEEISQLALLKCIEKGSQKLGLFCFVLFCFPTLALEFLSVSSNGRDHATQGRAGQGL